MFRRIRQHVSLKYLLMTAGTIGGVFTLLFFWVSHRQERHILEQVRQQAEILHRQIVLTRQWVSDHNYILVAAPPGGVDAPRAAAAGAASYTKITPAEFTRQLSAYASRDDQYSFNITNVNAKNPRNVPDAFEVRALRLFSEGKAGSLTGVEIHDRRHVFRYAAPLTISASCLGCHQHQDFRVGDLGGCISVLLPFENARQAIRRENAYLFTAMFGLTGTVVVVLFLLSQKLLFRPIREIRQATRRLWRDELGERRAPDGDELRDFAALFSLVDEKLKNQHEELEASIRMATADLHRTNRELARANEVLQSLNRSKSEFFSEVSHELRTPLTAIKGAVDTLKRKDACSDPGYLDIIGKNTDHLIGIIVDFLDHARLETGNLELEIAPAPLGEVIRDVIAAQNPIAEKAGVSIIFTGGDGPDIPMDRRRIFQAVANITANAIRFSPAGGRITVTAEYGPEMATVGIRDEGPGIPEPYREAIFQKFFRVPEGRDRTGGPRAGSCGIGLAVCKGLIQAHGGRIRVACPPEGGSVFWFQLPRSGPAPAAPTEGRS